MLKKCIIFGAAKIHDECIVKKHIMNNDYIICADGGYGLAKKNGIIPDLFVGDMDSVGSIDYTDSCKNENMEKIFLPKKKDETDMMFAVKIAIEKGFKELLIFGGLGERVDHTYANFCLLKNIHNNGASAKLIDHRSEVSLVDSNQKFFIKRGKGKIISIFPFGCLWCSVSYCGLEYKINNQKLFIDNPIGVSNVVSDDSASVTVHEGCAIVILSL